MPDYQILKTEISLPAYAVMTDSEVIEALEAKTIPQLVPITKAQLVAWVAANFAVYGALQAIVGVAGHPLQGAAWGALRTIDTPNIESLDLRLPDIQILLGGLLQGGVLTQSQYDSLITIGTVLISRADQLGLGQVQLGDIPIAKGWGE